MYNKMGGVGFMAGHHTRAQRESSTQARSGPFLEVTLGYNNEQSERMQEQKVQMY